MEEEAKECNGDAKAEGTVFSTSFVSDNSCDNAVNKLASVQRRISGPTRRSAKGGWTEEEDKILAFAVRQFNYKNWKRVAEYVPDRTAVQCLHRWQKVLNPDLVKGPWTKEEDELIVELVGKQGNKKWCEIAKSLPGRIGKQCRERWHNHLNPDINKTAWTKEEELTLIKAHEIFGNKWAEIAKFLNGRTENSIKNHWNCSVKKKADLYLARGYVLCNYETKDESRNFEAPIQSLADPKMNSKSGTVDACSLDLTLGNANAKEKHLQPFMGGNCRFLREEGNDPTTPSVGTLFDKNNAAVCGATNVKMPGDSHHFTARNRPNESRKTSLRDLLNSSLSHKHTQEPTGDFINPLPPRSLSEPFLTTPFIATGPNTKNRTLPHQLPQPVMDKIFPPESCRRPHDESCRRPQDNARTPQNLKDVNFGRLCSEYPQMEDLNILLATGRFPSTENYIRKKVNPVYYQSPPTHDRKMFVSCSSPESILRSAARSFKNMPSIIRKRGLRTFRQTGNANHCDGIYTLVEKTDNSSNIPHSVRLCPFNKDDNLSGVLRNEKQIFLSPPKTQKLGNSAATNKSIEKRLEYAFDTEWDSTNS